MTLRFATKRSVHTAAATLAPALLAGALLLAGCGARTVPRWVERPPEDERYVYAVGVRTGGATIEEARQGAVEQAVAELVRSFRVTSQTSYEEIRTELETRVRDEVQSASDSIRIEDAVVQESEVRRRGAGFDAFVLLRYPREQVAREKQRLRAQESARLHAAHQALRRGDAALEQGGVGAAIVAYAGATRATTDSAAGSTLRTQALERLSKLASTLRLQVVGGDLQSARVMAPLAEPLAVRLLLAEQPARGVPIAFRVGDETEDPISAHSVTGQDGMAEVSISQVRTSGAALVIEASIEPDLLDGMEVGPGDASIASVLQTIRQQRVVFQLPVDRSRHALRIAVLVDERRQGTAAARSILAAMLRERLQRSGFRVVADHELGKSNQHLTGQMLDSEQVLPLHRSLLPLVDVVVAGWCETRPGSDNFGWTSTALADAELRAVSVVNGELLAAANAFGQRGFGEGADRAAFEAVRGLADRLADDLVLQLNRSAYDAEPEPVGPEELRYPLDGSDDQY